MVRTIYLIDRFPLQFLLVHLATGVIVSRYSIMSTFWGLAVLIIGVHSIIKYRNRSNLAGLFTGYLVGLEIVLRMTNAGLLWEFGKYGAIVFLILGLTMENIKHHRTSVLIIFYLLSFLPSLSLLSLENFNYLRQTVAFNLSGPVTLFVSFLYFRNRRMIENEIINLFRLILMPLLTMSVILVIRTPEIDNIVFSSEANFQMSGGYGPNQVSSALGLVITIISLSKILDYTLFGKNRYDYAILAFCVIQAYLTFARGGVLAAILAILAAWLISLGQKSSKYIRKGKIAYVIIILLILWNVAGNFTRGMMEKRYLSMFDVDESGELSGSARMLIMAIDLEIFFDNMVIGVGPGAARNLRQHYGYNKPVNAHSEFTRTLAEHGLFGFFGLCSVVLLAFREFLLRTKKEKCFLVCFATLSILTMLHSAMRLAMPGFIFGLGFFKLYNIQSSLYKK